MGIGSTTRMLKLSGFLSAGICFGRGSWRGGRRGHEFLLLLIVLVLLSSHFKRLSDLPYANFSLTGSSSDVDKSPYSAVCNRSI